MRTLTTTLLAFSLLTGCNKGDGNTGTTDTGSGGDETGGDETGGDETGGDETGGDETGGDETGGDETGGDETGGDETGGDETGGDETGGDETGGDPSLYLSGDITYTSQDLDKITLDVTTTRCDTESKIRSRPYDAGCPDCIFTFLIDTEVTEDRSLPGCEALSRLSFVPHEDLGPEVEFALGFARETTVKHETTAELITITNALFSTTPDPYWTGIWMPIAGDVDGPAAAEAEAAEDVLYSSLLVGNAEFNESTGELIWESIYLGSEYRHTYRDASCGWPEVDAEEGEPVTTLSAATSHEVDGDFRCETVMGGAAWYVGGTEVWSANFTAGDTVRVSVDTFDERYGFNPSLVITNADTCFVAEADDGMDCSSGTSDHHCPVTEFVVESTGTHNILVEGDECTGHTADYTLGVDAPSDPELRRIERDAHTWHEQPVLHTVRGTAMVSTLEE